MTRYTPIFVGLVALFSTTFVNANNTLIEKANLARAKAEEAFFLCNERAMENHRALIAAYWIHPGDTVLDLGAHIGSYALYYDKLVKVTGRVLAYEASPLVYGHLLARISSLPVTSISTINKAVSDSSNKLIPMKVYLNDVKPQCASLEPKLWSEERMSGDTAIIDAVTEQLDDLLKDDQIQPIRFIKIDVEGHEHAVIKGAKQLLLTHRPLVIFEYGFQKGYWEPNTIQQIEELGYVCYDCNTDKRVHPGYGSLSTPYLLTDILAIPKEFEEEIILLLPYLY
ncbi:MAG: FkbM family methyltransferase [Chlamydiota bacterium]|jgi:FkbM family methyltransferase